MAALGVLLVAVVLGGGDQYLGSLEGHYGHFVWASDLSVMSAPWLLLAFVAGCTQRDPRRAALLGLGATYAALLGYMLMTLSPIERAQLTTAAVVGFAHSEAPTLVGGVIVGPLFGWLGQRWRVHRSWLSAVIMSLALCLEPLAHVLADRTVPTADVALAEVGVGLTLATYFAVLVRRSARSGATL
jgi:uncharacterized MnhB-related membrane protein